MQESFALSRQERLISLDAYRGFVMLAMVSSGFGFKEVASHLRESRFWSFLAFQFTHVEWQGCSFWDLIQPSFMFMVGVALPYSYARRKVRGQTYAQMVIHAAYRSCVLILLGTTLLMLLGNWINFKLPKKFNINFYDILSQIGLSYFFVFFLVGRKPWIQSLWILGILTGYWLAFFLYPLPGPDFNFALVGGAADSQRYSGLFAHWNKNTNFAWAVDRWFLNLFPRSDPYYYHQNGLQTLNFIPSIATMVLGIMAGELLRSSKEMKVKLKLLLLGGAVCLIGGLLLGCTLCPIVKAIWTPSWTLFSAGWTFWLLAFFYGIIDIRGWSRWVFPLEVVGLNSISIYCLYRLIDDRTLSFLRFLLGKGISGSVYGPIWLSVGFMVVLWGIAWCQYRRRLFIRI